MAVELAKVALWIETVDPGLPLGFFDSNIRCGDSLIGIFDLKVLERGIPEAAYKTLIGDDKDTAGYYARRNRDENSGQGSLDFTTGGGKLPPAKQLIDIASELRFMGEDTLEQIRSKAGRFTELRSTASWSGIK